MYVLLCMYNHTTTYTSTYQHTLTHLNAPTPRHTHPPTHPPTPVHPRHRAPPSMPHQGCPTWGRPLLLPHGPPQGDPHQVPVGLHAVQCSSGVHPMCTSRGLCRLVFDGYVVCLLCVCVGIYDGCGIANNIHTKQRDTDSPAHKIIQQHTPTPTPHPTPHTPHPHTSNPLNDSNITGTNIGT